MLPTGFRTFHFVSFLYVFFCFLFFFFCFVSFLTILFSFFCVSFFSLLFSLFSFRFFFFPFLFFPFLFFLFLFVFSVSQFTGTPHVLPKLRKTKKWRKTWIAVHFLLFSKFLTSKSLMSCCCDNIINEIKCRSNQSIIISLNNFQYS